MSAPLSAGPQDRWYIFGTWRVAELHIFRSAACRTTAEKGVKTAVQTFSMSENYLQNGFVITTFYILITASLLHLTFGYCLITAWLLQHYCIITPSLLVYDYCQVTFQLLLDYFIITSWLLQITALLLLDYCKLLFYYCLITASLLRCYCKLLVLHQYFSITASILLVYCTIARYYLSLQVYCIFTI